MLKYNEDIKTKCFDLLGGKCVQCGFSDYRALNVDHINRRQAWEKKKRGGADIYLRILKGKRSTNDLQLLCCNCNWIKKHENHEVSKIE